MTKYEYRTLINVLIELHLKLHHDVIRQTKGENNDRWWKLFRDYQHERFRVLLDNGRV